MKLKYNDSMHAYWIDGQRCKGVTGIAGIPDDGTALELWGKRSVLEGVARKPELLELAQHHVGDNGKLNEIAKQALAAAGSGDKADHGTAIHRLIERHLRGEEIIHTPETRSRIAAWDKALTSAGLTVEPEYIERIVCFPSQLIAGRSDVFVSKKRSKSLFVADLKTGKVRYPHKMAIQLAVYANAPTLAGELDFKGETETFTENADLNLKTAYIIHSPSPDEITVYTIDIAAGWEIAKKAIFPILEWRKRKDLLKPVSVTPIIDPAGIASDAHVAWIQERLAKIDAAGDGAKQLTITRWPHGITPRPPWSEGDIDALDGCLTTVERDAAVSF